MMPAVKEWKNDRFQQNITFEKFETIKFKLTNSKKVAKEYAAFYIHEPVDCGVINLFGRIRKVFTVREFSQSARLYKKEVNQATQLFLATLIRNDRVVFWNNTDSYWVMSKSMKNFLCDKSLQCKDFVIAKEGTIYSLETRKSTKDLLKSDDKEYSALTQAVSEFVQNVLLRDSPEQASKHIEMKSDASEADKSKEAELNKTTLEEIPAECLCAIL